MGDKNSNQPRTLGDYSRPRHEGYRNAIELPEGAKVAPYDPTPSDSLNLNGATRNTTRLRLLCFSLRDQAINWLDRLPVGSISTWDDLTTRFLAQFFPPGRTAKLRKDILMFQQHQDESLYDAWTRFKDLLQKVPHHGERLRKLRSEVAWETIEDLAQYEEEKWNDPIFFKKESPDYIDATLEQELESMECRVESLMRNEVLLEYEVVFTFLKRPYQEELEAWILNLIDHQEDQVRQLKEDIRKTKDRFMCLADSFIATLKVKIEAQQAHSIKIEKITTFPTHTPTVTPETLKPTMVHRVSMISKLEYEDEDEVEIKMIGTEMDKESLEHNLHENDMNPIICHNFSPTSNPPIKPKDSGIFRMEVIFDEKKLGSS
ncbi:zinc finger, CCHC-type containing protein [Tanacetum coccineum]